MTLDYYTTLNYICLFLDFFVVLVFIYGSIVIKDIPYEIAKKRNHPHQDAIYVAGWVSLLTLNVMWPFLWVWASLYREDRGWGLQQSGSTDSERSQSLESRLFQMESRFDKLENAMSEMAISRPGNKPLKQNAEGEL